jgi:tetratricopeptide (TPR) repeat protein
MDLNEFVGELNTYKYYKRSLDINPIDLNTWRNMGLAHEALGQREDARLAYKQIALRDLLLNLLYPLIGFVGPCFLIVLLINFLGSNSDSWLVWIFSVLIIIIIGISFRILKTNVPIVLRIYFKRY